MAADPDLPVLTQEPVRISRNAALSLVAALFCCIPGIGLIAAVLGVVALYRIGGSGGKLGGRTLAAVGLTLGLISTSVWLSLGLGMRQAYATYTQSVAAPMVKYFQAVPGTDPAPVVAIFDASAQPTQAQIDAFRSQLASQLGTPVGPINTLDDAQVTWAMRGSVVGLDATRQYVSGPLRFEKSLAMVLFRLAPNTPPTAYFPATGVDQIIILLPSGQSLKFPDGVEAAR
jgi:hypothetical protein